MKLKNKKIIIYLLLLTTLSKFISFVREIVIASIYGVTSISDVYIVALSIPMILFSGICTALLTSYIPINKEIKRDKNIEGENEFTINLIKIIFIVMLVLVTLGILGSRYMVKLFFNSDNNMLDLAISLTKINFPIVIPLVISNVLIGYLQCNNSLITPNISLLLYNIVFFIGVIGYRIWGIYGITCINVIGVIVQTIYLYNICKKNGLKFNFKTPTLDKNVIKIILMSIPIFIGVFSQQLNNLVDKFLAANIGDGVVSAFSYSNKMILLIYGFVVVLIDNFVYPKIANFTGEEIRKKILVYNNTILLLLAPIIVMFTIFSEEIVRVVFMRGAFSYDAVKITASILKWYSLCIIFWAIRDLFSKVLFLHKDTKAPMLNTIFGTILNIVLSILLSIRYGYEGIAIATFISSVITAVAIIYLLIKKYNFYFNKKEIIFIFSIGISMIIVFNIMSNFKIESTSNMLIIIKLGVVYIINLMIFLLIMYIINKEYLKSLFKGEVI